MKNTTNTHQPNPAVAGIAGAVVGAGVAIAATKVLSDKKTREAIMDTIADAKDHVLDSMKQAKDKVEDTKEAVSQEIQKKKKELKKAA